MFHAELANTCVKSEIESLDKKNKSRSGALKVSKEMLNKDQLSLMEFVEKDNKQKDKKK
jgi:hypothetical protein